MDCGALNAPWVFCGRWTSSGTRPSPAGASLRLQWSVARRTQEKRFSWAGHLSVCLQHRQQSDTYADPGVLEGLLGYDPLGWIDCQHLVDQVFGLWSHCVPLWRRKLRRNSHWLTGWLAFLLTDWLIYYLTDWLTDCFHWLSLTDWQAIRLKICLLLKHLIV